MIDPTSLSADELLATIAGIGQHFPSDLFAPNPAQQGFFASQHRIRLMGVGNRFGKSLCMGIEAARELRRPRVDVVWVCPKFEQFEQVRRQRLEPQCFDSGHNWNASAHRYEWPNGSRLCVFSNESTWENVQGIAPTLVCVDEECDIRLWRELRARVDKRPVRFILAATPTRGSSWMEHEIYAPWRAYHADLGIDEDRAILEQRHPTIWCLPRGGIADNPTIPATERAEFAAQTWTNETEWRIRNRGGFGRISETPVFDMAGLDWQRQWVGAGESGGLVLRRVTGQ